MSNELPFNPVECQVMGIDKAKEQMEFYTEFYELDTKKHGDMNGPLFCSEWDPANCSIGRLLTGSTQFVDTDYDTYFILHTCVNWAGVGVMPGFWVGAKQPY